MKSREGFFVVFFILLHLCGPSCPAASWAAASDAVYARGWGPRLHPNGGVLPPLGILRQGLRGGHAENVDAAIFRSGGGLKRRVDGSTAGGRRAAAGETDSRDGVDDFTREGDDLYGQGKYKQAVEKYSEALGNLSSSVRGEWGSGDGGNVTAAALLGHRGSALLMLGRYAEAVVDCKTAAALDKRYYSAHICAGKALLALGRSTEANHAFMTVQARIKAQTPRISDRPLLRLLEDANEGLTKVQTYDNYVHRGFNNLQSLQTSQEDGGSLYLPVVGRWRAWRKTTDASHDFSNPGMTDKERKAAKKIALAADTAKCAQRALLVSPAATEPLILKAWALVTAGNSTAATNFCVSQLSQNGTRSGMRSKRGGGGGLGGVQAAAELWLIHGRSLCLDGDPILARSVFQRAIQSSLAARQDAGMPTLDGLAPGEACNLSRRLSQRDVERLLRECNFQVSQINQIQACLKAANQRKNAGNADAAADEYARALAIDPNNPAHVCKVSALRAQVLLSNGQTRQAVESARLSLNESQKLPRGVWGVGGLGREADVVLGTGLSMMGEHEEAIKAFKAGLARCMDGDKEEFMAQVRQAKERRDRAEMERYGDIAGLRKDKDSTWSGGIPGFSSGFGFDEFKKRAKKDHEAKWGAFEDDFRAAYERFTRQNHEARQDAGGETFNTGPPPSFAGDRPSGSSAGSQGGAGGGGGGFKWSAGIGSKAGFGKTAARGRNMGMYSVLEIAPGSTPAEIKKSYMKMALKFHPDKYKGANPKAAEEKFKMIKKAYETLSDPGERDAHDRDHGINQGGRGGGFADGPSFSYSR